MGKDLDNLTTSIIMTNQFPREKKKIFVNIRRKGKKHKIFYFGRYNENKSNINQYFFKWSTNLYKKPYSTEIDAFHFRITTFVFSQN